MYIGRIDKRLNVWYNVSKSESFEEADEEKIIDDLTRKGVLTVFNRHFQFDELEPVAKGDFRKSTGAQDFVYIAPVNLVYVADYAKMGRASDADKATYSAADTGFISQNVYLFCASEGLATGVRGMVARDELAQTMKLRPDQKIVLAQSVGYPKK